MGTSSPTGTYRGQAGIAEFSVSFTVQCAAGFSGDRCRQCEGIICENGQCEGELNNFVCVCDPGYTGERCQNTLGNSHGMFE